MGLLLMSLHTPTSLLSVMKEEDNSRNLEALFLLSPHFLPNSGPPSHLLKRSALLTVSTTLRPSVLLVILSSTWLTCLELWEELNKENKSGREKILLTKLWLN